jgi:hemerythrin
MGSFCWNRDFETGIPDVDRQHRRLVDIVNRLGDLLTENKIVFSDIEGTIKELIDYAQYHFREEQKMMIDTGMDRNYLSHHFEIHKSFLEEINYLRSDISQDNLASAKKMLDFLVHWLVYHILGEDQNMAGQIKAIQSGVMPHEAYERGMRERDKALEPLLAALNGLFEQVSARNRELVILNRSLEAKVAERTRELSETNLKLEKLSLTDFLTGLPNRRHAMRSLTLIWEEAVKNDLPLIGMMIDVDNFKKVNDTYGHDVGDIVISEVAKTLLYSVRTDDIVCRMGGDEFFVICPNTDNGGGMYIAELLHKTMSELHVPTGNEVWHGGISVGVASRTPDMKNYGELVKSADKALYLAKQNGKNCVYFDPHPT